MVRPVNFMETNKSPNFLCYELSSLIFAQNDKMIDKSSWEFMGCGASRSIVGREGKPIFHSQNVCLFQGGHISTPSDETEPFQGSVLASAVRLSIRQ